MLQRKTILRGLALCTTLVGLVFSSAVNADDSKPKYRARGIIRSGVDKEGRVHGDFAKVTGLKNASSLSYKVLVLDEDGKEKFVDEENFKFKIGQKFRLQIETDTDLYVYVFHEGGKGERTMLLPDHHDNGRVPKSARDKKTVIPDDGTHFEFVPPAGTERLLVYATPEIRKELTPKEAFEDTDKTTRLKLKTAQDAVFNEARTRKAKALDSQNLEELAQANTKVPGFRKRGLVWKPKADANDGKTIFAGTYGESEKPDLFIEIPLTSNQR